LKKAAQLKNFAFAAKMPDVTAKGVLAAGAADVAIRAGSRSTPSG